jgi:hypothetical protein
VKRILCDDAFSELLLLPSPVPLLLFYPSAPTGASGAVTGHFKIADRAAPLIGAVIDCVVNMLGWNMRRLPASECFCIASDILHRAFLLLRKGSPVRATAETLSRATGVLLRQLAFLTKMSTADDQLMTGFGARTVAIVALLLTEGQKIFDGPGQQSFVYELTRSLIDSPLSTILAKSAAGEEAPGVYVIVLHDSIRWVDQMTASIAAHIQAWHERNLQNSPAEDEMRALIREGHEKYCAEFSAPSNILVPIVQPDEAQLQVNSRALKAVETLSKSVISDYREVIQILPNLKN